MLAALGDPSTWTALFEIAVINIVLSGDNAVVIALACRGLPPRQQRSAFIVGTGGIVVLMTTLTACAALLMTLPYIQIVGSVLLVWIGIKLLLPENEDGSVSESRGFWEAVKTIIIADIVMSMFRSMIWAPSATFALAACASAAGSAPVSCTTRGSGSPSWFMLR